MESERKRCDRKGEEVSQLALWGPGLPCWCQLTVHQHQQAFTPYFYTHASNNLFSNPSIFYLPFCILAPSQVAAWLRPKEMVASPTLFAGTRPALGDVCQGALGDCWFLGAVAGCLPLVSPSSHSTRLST